VALLLAHQRQRFSASRRLRLLLELERTQVVLRQVPPHRSTRSCRIGRSRSAQVLLAVLAQVLVARAARTALAVQRALQASTDQEALEEEAQTRALPQLRATAVLEALEELAAAVAA
jgi:hypothetical protein